MLTPYKPQFIEQIFTDQTGRQFRLVFLVSLVDGKLKGQLVSAQPLATRNHSTAAGHVSDQFLLPFSCPKDETVTEYIASVTPIVSPFSTIEFLITSQPTRAPSFK